MKVTKHTSRRAAMFQIVKRTRNVLPVAAAFLVVGSLLVLAAHAATLADATEAESGTVGAPATIVTGDSAASGAAAVRFGTGSTGPACPPYLANSTAAGCGFPTAATTGPVGCTSYSTYGDLSISTDGATLNCAKVNGLLTVSANNVTVQNSIITRSTNDAWWAVRFGTDCANNSPYTGFHLLHSTVQSVPGQGPDNGGYDYSISDCSSGMMELGYNNISGFKDGVDTDGTMNIHDNYIHDLSVFSGAHTQDIYVYPGVAVSITHNTLIGTITGGTAAIYIAPDSPNQHDVTVNNNWLAGGAYCIYGGDTNAKNIVVTNNMFSTEVASGCGQFGAVAYWQAGNSGNIWSDNIWANGPSVGQAISP